MKIGTQTNSLVNHLYGRATIGQPVPVVGMGATALGWTDRRAATIVSATELTSKQWQYEVEVVLDSAQVVSGSVQDGSAKYEFTPRADGWRDLYRFCRKTQAWVSGRINKDTGRFLAQKSGGGLLVGQREQYIDPSF